MNITYTEFHCISNFSFLEGASHPEELVQQAARLGYKGIAITDKNSLSGIVRAHFEAKKHNINFIVGSWLTSIYSSLSTAQHEFKDETKLPLSLLLFPSHLTSYAKLSNLITTGNLRSKDKCPLTLQDIEEHSRGIQAIVIIESFKDKHLLTYLKKLNNIFSADRLSLAISEKFDGHSYNQMHLTQELSKITQIPLIATNHVKYHEISRKPLLDVLSCIKNHCTLSEAGFLLDGNSERYLKSPEQIFEVYKKFPQSIERTSELLSLTSKFSLDDLKYEYPNECFPPDKQPLEYLTELSNEGLKQKYPDKATEVVKEQVKKELKIIKELGYEKYFLTVFDIVNFARKNNILCQGRGAAANSALCYVLGITAVDPDKVSLLFERFISKERNEPPDIDIDFEHERREEVIQYIYTKYGRLRASLTAEVVTYRSKSAIRDISKTFGLNQDQANELSKLVAREDRIEVIKNKLSFPIETSILEYILIFKDVLKGFPRHLSQHVGGFIVCNDRLSELVPITPATMANRTMITWNKDDLDLLGILRIDILALGMLTAIRKTFDLLEQHALFPRKKLDLKSIPQDDPKVYEMVSQADTIGVFQIESRAQMSMLPRLKPRCFYDLVIEVAIIRPGPIQGGMIHPYLKRRENPSAVRYPNEALKKILSPTLGVPIFQEQVMGLAIHGANFTPGEADQLRRAMASWKKDNNKLLKFQARLAEGMRENGYSAEFAQQVFSQIKGFGEYGFPQSHAASFALLVYISAWLKYHYPAYFTVALLNSQPMGFYQPAQLIEDAKRHDVKIFPLDINKSKWEHTVESTTGKGSIRLGFSSIKYLQASEVAKIIHARLNAPFKSIKHLFQSVQLQLSTMKLLARAGCFQTFGLNKRQALWEIAKFKDDKLPLLEFIEEQDTIINYLPKQMPLEEIQEEYQNIGFTLKEHPLNLLREKLKRRGLITISDFKLIRNRSNISTAGIVIIRQRPQTAKGFIFLTIEDETGIGNVIVKPKVFDAYKETILDSQILEIEGEVQTAAHVTNIIAKTFRSLNYLFEDRALFSRDFH